MVPIIQAIGEKKLNANIVCVGSNKTDAGILERAEQCGFSHVSGDETELSKAMKAANVDLIVLIGYMKILSAQFVAEWRRKVINIHPSLLPRHAGLMNLKVHQAVIDSGDRETGCTVHYVEEVVDAGEVIIQLTCPVSANDSADSLKTKVQALEGDALINAIKKVSDASRRS